MDLDDIKRGLRSEIKKRENEQYATFQCNVRQMCKDVLTKLEEQEAAIAENDKELRHQKYKRCLAMAYAEWLKQMSLWNYPESILYRRAVRRERKWKEMAEKFKEGLVIGVDKARGTDKTVVINYKETDDGND